MENKDIKTLAEFGVTKHEKVLQNGLKTIFIEKPFSPIYAKLVIGAGSVFNPSDNGLAHFVEHIIMSGTKNLSRVDFFGIMESVGGLRNAYTSKNDMTIVAEVAEASQLPAIARFFTEAIETIYITPTSLQKEKEVIFSEIQKRINENPYHEPLFKLRSVITQGNPWGYSILGELDEMMKITISDVEDFFSKYCVVENMALVIAGGCKISDIEKNFSKIKFLHGAKQVFPEGPKVIETQRLFSRANVSQAKLLVGFNGPVAGSRDSHILNLATSFAHSGMASRFYRSIRGEKALAYTLSGVSLVYNKLKYFGTEVGVPCVKLDDTIDAVLDCYKGLIVDCMTQEEIDNKVKTWWFSVKRSMERSVDWVEQFDSCLFEDPNPLFGDFPDVYNFRKSITADDVRRVIEQYITTDLFHLHVVSSDPGKKYF